MHGQDPNCGEVRAGIWAQVLLKGGEITGNRMQSQIKSVGDSPLTSAGVESEPNQRRGVKNEQWGMRKERTESDVEWGKIPSALLAAALGK